MVTVVLLIHIMIAAALVAVVLLQRSEGGALGIGGGGGGLLTGRGTANLLTRLTAGLAAAFFVTSTILSLMAQRSAPPSVFDQPSSQPGTEGPATPGQDSTPRGGVLDRLQPPGTPSVPQDR
jgi:preprotein translocase subunit SecG